MQLIEFLIERALFVRRQATAMLSAHVARFLRDGVESAVQIVTTRRRVVALVHVIVDVVRFIRDTAVDLLAALQGNGMWVLLDHDARSGRGTGRLDNATRQTTNHAGETGDQCESGQAASLTLSAMWIHDRY